MAKKVNVKVSEKAASPTADLWDNPKMKELRQLASAHYGITPHWSGYLVGSSQIGTINEVDFSFAKDEEADAFLKEVKAKGYRAS